MGEALQKVTQTWEWNNNRERAAHAIASNKTLTDAAKDCGISRQTLTAWMKVPEFRARVDEHIDAVVEDARLILRRNANFAAQRVVDMAFNASSEHSVRLAAAKDILDRVGLKAPEKIEHEHTGIIEHHAIAVEGRLLDLARRSERAAVLSEPDE